MRPHAAPTPLVDLTPSAGLPVRLQSSTGELLFEDDVVSQPPGARRLYELAPVLRDGTATGREVLYHLYRDVRRGRDAATLARAGLRYDLTVTLPGRIGDEYAKTAGHYHPPDADDGVSFPEIYEIVHGRAAFVLQEVDDITAERPRVLNVWVQLGVAGDRIVIPPNCGHVTVNIGPDALVVADLISTRCGHLYGTFRSLRGAAYYVVVDPSAPHDLRLEANRIYGPVPAPVVATGSRWHPTVPGSRPVYATLRERPQDFTFLDRPAESAETIRGLWPAARAR